MSAEIPLRLEDGMKPLYIPAVLRTHNSPPSPPTTITKSPPRLQGEHEAELQRRSTLQLTPQALILTNPSVDRETKGYFAALSIAPRTREGKAGAIAADFRHCRSVPNVRRC